MADEAILRIVVDDGGSQPTPTAPYSPSPPQSTGRQPTTVAPAATQITPPAPPKSQPVPVQVVQPPPPIPAPAAPPKGAPGAATSDLDQITDALGMGPALKEVLLPPEPVVPPPQPAPKTAPPPAPVPTTQSTDFMQSLINPAEGVNPHVLLEGQSGSGKSLAAKHIAFERMKQGQEVNVVDTHTPEAWGGAKQVFQGATAGEDAAAFLKKALASRKTEATEAKLKGELPDFKPMTVVFSDFARLMKDTPKLGVEFATLLTEARKFRISIIADTTALTGAATGIKGVQDVLNNFGQKVKFTAPTAQGGARKAEVAGQEYDVPQLPDYRDRTDFGLVQPPKPPPPPPSPEPELSFDPLEVAKKRIEAEERRAAVDAEYRKMKPPKPPEAKPAFDSILEAAESMRGVVGGTFGKLAGIALDITAGLRRNRAKMEEASSAPAPLALPAPSAPTAAIAPVGSQNAPAPAAIPIPKAEIAPLGQAVGTATLSLSTMIPAVVGATAAFNVLTGAIDASVQRYGDYSPDVAQAQAMVEVRQTMNDMRRAQEHGPELARYVESQARMQEKFEEAKMKFLSKIMPIVEAIFEFLGAIMEGVSAIPDLAMNLATPLASIATGVQESVAMQRDDRFGDVADPTSVLFQEGDKGVQVPEL